MHESYHDYEVVTAGFTFSIAAADLDGNTARGLPDGDQFEGVQLIDYDEVVDRHERLDLLRADHRMTAYVASTSTADGTLRASMQVSSSPVSQANPPIGFGTADGDVGFAGRNDDTIDIVGRNLQAVATAPFSDGGTGVGGGGAAESDEVVVYDLPGPLKEFHPRDELFANGRLEVQNVADAAVHADLQIQHLYGVVGDE